MLKKSDLSNVSSGKVKKGLSVKVKFRDGKFNDCNCDFLDEIYELMWKYNIISIHTKGKCREKGFNLFGERTTQDNMNRTIGFIYSNTKSK